MNRSHLVQSLHVSWGCLIFRGSRGANKINESRMADRMQNYSFQMHLQSSTAVHQHGQFWCCKATKSLYISLPSISSDHSYILSILTPVQSSVSVSFIRVLWALLLVSLMTHMFNSGAVKLPNCCIEQERE